MENVYNLFGIKIVLPIGKITQTHQMFTTYYAIYHMSMLSISYLHYCVLTRTNEFTEQ